MTVEDTPESRPWLPALAWLAGLTPFFFLSYGFANWVTAQRGYVPQLAFGWERGIPFLPWTIVPYWSTDLFYAGSLFLCRTRAELRTHGRRLIAVQAICVAGFLVVPLRFGFTRPPVSGLFGGMFRALAQFDQPFNQAPSLHVAMTAVLWAAYGRHFRGWALGLIRAWFVLMALSTLTTWQHHFIDVPAGLWAGLLVVALFPHDGRAKAPAAGDAKRWTLGAAYLTGAVLCGVAGAAAGGAGWLLLWPAGALAVVAGIYWSGRGELFGKVDGALPPAVIVVLGPYLAGAWLSSRWFTRREPRAVEIADGVWLGRMPRRAERAGLGIRSLVDVTAEMPCASGGIEYRGIPMLDLLTPTAAQLDAAVRAIRELEAARPTLVCCALGYSRSAAAVAAWLVAEGKEPGADAAIERIRARRPAIVISEACRAQLERRTPVRSGQ